MRGVLTMESDAIRFVVLTLNTSARQRFTADTLRARYLPASSTEIFASISGFDKRATLGALAASGLR